MGYYINTTGTHGKADEILGSEEDAREVSLSEARDVDKAANGVVVVMNNGPFEAAGFAFDQREFEAFTEPDDTRPIRFVVMSRKRAEELSSYPPERM